MSRIDLRGFLHENNTITLYDLQQRLLHVGAFQCASFLIGHLVVDAEVSDLFLGDLAVALTFYQIHFVADQNL